MAAPISHPESYHVGWVCAVRTEYVAACELLDEEFPTPPLPHHDDNAYTCGRIGDHKVVVACLPQGRYGLTSAATVAKDMRRSFPAIRFGLMVGMAGGAPSTKHDIRLGDVVKLSALHERRGHRITETVNRMISKNPRLKKNYQHPDPALDVLYPSSLVHAELAYRTRDNRPNCSVFWVPATSVENIQQAYLEIARQLQIQVGEKMEDVVKLVQDALSQESTGQWLLILDNADDIDLWLNNIDTKSTRLIDCLPRSNNGSIIFTTRSRKAAVKFAPAIIQVPEKDEDVATQILKNSLKNQEILHDHQAVFDFLGKLTFLPLAIIQAAAYINENDISLQDYLSLWDDTEENIIEVLSKDFEDEGRYRSQNQKNPVATTWLISFEQIRHRDKLAAESLSFMSCLDPKMIPQSLLPPAETKREALEAIGSLTAYSFIAKQKDQTFGLYRLVHLATRSWLRAQKSLTEWIRKATARLAAIFPDHNPRNRTLWRAYLPHASYLLSSSLENDGIDGRLLLLERFGLCLMSDGRYFESEEPLIQVMEKRKRMLGPEHPDTLASIGNLASTYWNQGRWKEAEELEVQVMEMRKRALGPEHPDTLTIMGNLASTYTNQGRWKEAEDLQVQVMKTGKRVLGSEHPGTLTIMGNLALTYTNQGRWKEAEDLEVQVMESAGGRAT